MPRIMNAVRALAAVSLLGTLSCDVPLDPRVRLTPDPKLDGRLSQCGSLTLRKPDPTPTNGSFVQVYNAACTSQLVIVTTTGELTFTNPGPQPGSIQYVNADENTLVCVRPQGATSGGVCTNGMPSPYPAIVPMKELIYNGERSPLLPIMRTHCRQGCATGVRG